MAHEKMAERPSYSEKIDLMIDGPIYFNESFNASAAFWIFIAGVFLVLGICFCLQSCVARCKNSTRECIQDKYIQMS